MQSATARLLCYCVLCLGAGRNLRLHAAPQGTNAAAATQSDDTYRIHGVVVDSHTGKPVPRALVQGYGDRMAALTDHEGRFAFTLRFTAPAGQRSPMAGQIRAFGSIFFGLTARKPGYVFRQRVMNAAVPIGSLEQDFVLKLTPESVIEGRVAASGDDHPENVRVSLLKRGAVDGYARWAPMTGVNTDSRGEYRFAGLEAGEYRITTSEWTDGPREPAGVDKPVQRYAPVFYPAGSAAKAGPGIRLEAGETLPVNLNLHPETFYPVRVPVAPFEGGNGVQVRVQQAGAAVSQVPGFNLRYNARDKVVEGVLPSGSYELFLQTGGPNGAATATVPFAVQGAPVETAPITLLPSVSIPVIVHEDFTHAGTSAAEGISPSRLSGRIVAQIDGKLNRTLPVQVMLRPAEGTCASVMLTQGPQESETPQLQHVPPGTYDVVLYVQQQGYVSAASCGGTDLLRAPLVVSASGGAAPIEITLRDDVGTLTGTVDAAETDGGTYQVMAVPAEGSRTMPTQGVAIRDGKFKLGNMAPGSYRVYASHEPMMMLEYRSEEFGKKNGSKGALVTVEPNGSATVTLTSVLEEEP